MLLMEYTKPEDRQALVVESNALWSAVEFGCPDKVALVLGYGVDINERVSYNMFATPLEVALRRDALGIARVLLENGCDIDHSAFAEVRSADALLLLLEYYGGALEMIDWVKHLYDNPLDWLDLLADYGAPIETLKGDPTWLLISAAERGLKQYVPYFLERGAGIHGTNNVAVYCRAGKLQSDWTPLHYAACRGHLSTARHLLVCGAQVDYRKTRYFQTSLHVAAALGNKQMVELLLHHGADANAAVSYQGTNDTVLKRTTFHFATYGKSPEIWQILLDRGLNAPKVDASYIAILLASRLKADKERNNAIMKFIIESYTASNGEFSLGHVMRDVTCLMGPYQDVEKEMMQALLDQITNQGHPRCTLAQAVTDLGDGYTVKDGFFEKMDEGVDTPDRLGKTILQYAVERHDLETVRFLLDNGAQVDISRDPCRAQPSSRVSFVAS
jgi:ankyrin repeat protein